MNQRTNGPVNDKSQQTVEAYSINISAKLEFKYLRLDQKKIANFHFFHFKSVETLSCHSNQISYPTEIKNTNYVEATVRNMYTKYRLHAGDNF